MVFAEVEAVVHEEYPSWYTLDGRNPSCSNILCNDRGCAMPARRPDITLWTAVLPRMACRNH